MRPNLFLLVLFFPLSAFAQAADSLMLKVRVVDSFERVLLDSACVEVLEADSARLLHPAMELTDGSSGSFVYGLAKSYFRAVVPRRPVYVLRAMCPGYESQYLRIVLSERRRDRKKMWDAKEILLRRDYGKGEQELDEATVTASRIAMVVKGDTIEYDARAFRLAEGSMLENLMELLPGMRLTADGRIYLNGEYVSRLMVNGRDFFNGNPKVALENLPAYTVDKIKAFHQEPAWAHMLDDKNSETEERPLVVDVRLKREYAQGWIANFEAGGGAKTRGGGDGIYLGRVFGMRYTDHSGLGVYGGINNMGDGSSPGRKGQWKRLTPEAGDRTMKMGGVNLDVDGKRSGTKFETTLEASRQDVSGGRQTTSLTYDGPAQKKYFAIRSDNEGTTDVKWRGGIQFSTKSTFTSIEPSVSYRHSGRKSATEAHQSISEDVASALWEDLYTRQTDGTGRSNTWQMRLRGTSMMKSPLTGKNLRFSGYLDYTHTKEWESIADLFVYARPSAGQPPSELRRDARPSHGYGYGVTIARNLFERKTGRGRVIMELSYTYSQNYDSGCRNRLTQLADSAAGDVGMGRGPRVILLPSALTERDWVADVANSYHITQMGRRHTANVQLLVHDKKFFLQLFPQVVYALRGISDFRNLALHRMERRDVYGGLRGNIMLNPFGIKFESDTRISPVALGRMIDVRDSSDPMNLFLGNPDLRKTVNQALSVSYSLRSQKRQRTFSASFKGEFVMNAIGNAREFDAQTGITTYRPRNIDGNRWGQSDLTYGQALDKKGCLMLSVIQWMKIIHSVDFAGDAATGGSLRSVVDNYIAGANLSLNYRTQGGISVGVKGTYSYTNQHARPLTYRGNDASEFSAGLTFTAPVTKHFIAETDLMAYGRRGYSEASMNTTDWVWNASLSYTFGKGGAWLVRAVGYDLLQQISNIRRVMNEQGYTETRYSSVPSYACLSLTYRLHVAPKHKK